MAQSGQLQYFPAKHLIGACLVIAIVFIVSLWPKTESESRTKEFVIDLPASSKADNAALNTVEWETTKVGSGDSLSVLFSRENLSASDVFAIASEVPSNVITLMPGQTVRWQRTVDNHVRVLELDISPLAKHVINRDETGKIKYELVERAADYVPQFASATINNSLYLDGNRAGVSDRVLFQLATIFGWDIDFALETRPGDSFSLIYEQVFLEGEKIQDGDILIAEFINQGRTYTAIRYIDENNNVQYYSPSGKSMKKAFLRNPIDFARISSQFNLNRRHPILNTIRAHRGTDYAARSGTPIKAVGSGKVVFAGVQRGYGNVVIIQHSSQYKTKYAHMSKFGRGIRNGKSVKQGDVIGYVGMTGLATGPHLHYEFLVNGVQRDYQKVKLPKEESIPAKNRKLFLAEAAKMEDWLNSFKATASSATASKIKEG